MAQSRSLQDLKSGLSQFSSLSDSVSPPRQVNRNPDSASVSSPDAKAPTISLPEQDPIGDTLGLIAIIAAI